MRAHAHATNELTRLPTTSSMARPGFRSSARLLVVLAIAVLSGGRSTPLRAQDWRSVDQTLTLVVDSGAEALSPRRLSRLRSAFDVAVTAELNAGTSLDSINRLLAHRPGYAGPSPGQSTLKLPNATFWRELPREAPTYFVAPVDSAATTLLAIMQSPSTNGPSHLSVFRRRQGRWERSSGFSSDEQVAAYRIPARDTAVFLATLETWMRADGSESRFKLWRLAQGQLHRLARPDTVKFQDADVEPTDSALVITVSQFAGNVSACTMCTRLYYAYLFTASGRGVSENAVSLNPWALLVDSLYAMTAKGETRGARALLPRSTSLKALSGKDPEFMADSGDPRAGDGRADILVRPGDCERYWRFRSVRQPSGAWKIVEVRPGRWTGDSVVFDDRARVQRHANHGCT